MKTINILVEGDLDEEVARRLIEYSGHAAGTCFGKKGFGYIQQRAKNYNLSCSGMYILALIDLMDTPHDCPVTLIEDWLPYRHHNMLLRAVVLEIESWLLSDIQNLSDFLNVNISRFPSMPEAVPDPKRELVNLARKSKSRRIKSALVPEANSTAVVGKLYTTEMIRFVRELWDVEQARTRSDSLNRCIEALKRVGK